MQLYVADYLGDTRHLTTEQHGAYLLLLMTMWRSEGVLSDDPAKLARIAGLTVARWKKISEDVLAFFTPCEGGLTQARLVAELTIADEKSEKRSQAGKAGGRAKALKDKKAGVANAKRSSWHSPEPEPEKKEEAIASLSPKPKSRSYPEAFEAAWKAYPHHKGRSSKPNAAAVWAKLPAEEREGMVAAIGRFVPNVADEISKPAPWAIYGVFRIVLMYVMPTGAAGLIDRIIARLRPARPATRSDAAAATAVPASSHPGGGTPS